MGSLGLLAFNIHADWEAALITGSGRLYSALIVLMESGIQPISSSLARSGPSAIYGSVPVYILPRLHMHPIKRLSNMAKAGGMFEIYWTDRIVADNREESLMCAVLSVQMQGVCGCVNKKQIAVKQELIPAS